MASKARRIIEVAVLAVLVVLLILLATHRQQVFDWWKLRDYQPPAAVAALARDDTMTLLAKHLFYINHPDLTNSSDFSKNCPAGTEKTVVLGCYQSNEAGIWVYKVTDPRLNGVEQVTAAHEMLHAAYDRLSSSERNRVDSMLLDYYHHGLNDSRIEDTLAAYKKSEPGNVVNEMHSIFGTEIANLPAPLQQYYTRYFTNRSAVTTYEADYQSEFTSRRTAVARYDAELASLKTQIDTNTSQLASDRQSLGAQRAQLQSEQNNPQAYNQDAARYNTAVDTYNQLVTQTKALINQYNQVVDERNKVVLEEQQLTQAITAAPQKVQ